MGEIYMNAGGFAPNICLLVPPESLSIPMFHCPSLAFLLFHTLDIYAEPFVSLFNRIGAGWVVIEALKGSISGY